MKKYFWTFAIFALCVVTINATAQVTKGLHFYMPFNEGKGDVVKDVGPKGFEAELHDSVKFVKGKVGTAIEFSEGPALIIDPGGQSELYVEHLTVAVWIHPFEISNTALGDGHVYGNIFYDKSGTSDDNVEFGLGSGEGIYWYINSGQKKMGPFNGADVDTTLSLPNLGLKPKNWYHVVGTFDGEKIQIYVDGKLEGEKDVPNNGPVMVWNDNNIEIGADLIPMGVLTSTKACLTSWRYTIGR
ncbi:MAG: LamG domain-containing protein [Candidatus Poribacteria bacterium]|nr:LamG domain-containing protein [Candidatus Poribacteria bacterium]